MSTTSSSSSWSPSATHTDTVTNAETTATGTASSRHPPNRLEPDAQASLGRHLQWVPIAVVLVAAVTSAIVFGLYYQDSHRRKHPEQPDVPYISEAGDWPVQSCYFTFGFALSAVGLLVITAVMFVEAKRVHLPDARQSRRFKRLNWWQVRLGCAASLGMLMVVSFQEAHAIWQHGLGATLFFWGTAIQSVLLTIMSWLRWQGHWEDEVVHLPRCFCIHWTKGLLLGYRIAVSALTLLSVFAMVALVIIVDRGVVGERTASGPIAEYFAAFFLILYFPSTMWELSQVELFVRVESIASKRGAVADHVEVAYSDPSASGLDTDSSGNTRFSY